MKDKELKLNASGYYDEPCYKTMTAPPKPGEIWTLTPSGHHMLIVANLNGVCSTLRLTETEREGCIPVTGRTLMFVTPIMLGYSFENTLGQYVKSIKGEEFEKVKKGIVKVLGLQDVKAYVKELEVKAADMLEVHTTRDKMQAEYDELLAETKALKKELKEKKDNCDAVLCELNATCMELEKAMVYKEMYMTLLDKVISARGGKRK